jgi:hypothetical protein
MEKVPFNAEMSTVEGGVVVRGSAATQLRVGM